MKNALSRRSLICAAGAAALFPAYSCAIGKSRLSQQTTNWKSLGRGRKPVVLRGPSAKWAKMIERHAEQEKKEALGYPGCRWRSMCQEVAGLAPTLDAVDTVNRLANDVTYLRDRKDRWATPREFANGGGDCEDFAIAKYFLLKRIGFSSENLGILLCLMNKESIQPHALTLLNFNGRAWVLDNLSKNLYLFENRKEITSVYFINEKYSVGFLSV